MTMSKYTLELGTLLQDPNFNLFDFDYKFYSDDAKHDFEVLFKDYYFYNEIGFETVKRFKHNLKTRLNLIYPYYIQLYNTELEAKDINFLLNKDLEETFTRDILSDNNNEVISNFSGTNQNNFKESNLDNGTASANLDSGSLTTVNNSVDNVTNENNVSTNGNNKAKEETKLISKGNIGTTSSAQLLRDYRSILININQLIIEECQNLFMEVY